MSCCVKNWKIFDFDAMEKLWHNSMYEALKINPDNHSILLTESCEYTNACR